MSATVTLRVPGRVNLIGGHVDFHDGPVVAAAIDRHLVVEVSDIGGLTVRVGSEQFDTTIVLDATGEPKDVPVPAWGLLAAAVLGELHRRGRPAVGFAAHVRSQVPVGGGLSSSAAFEVGIALAACHAARWALPPDELAVAAQRAEHVATGVECGIQDQLAIVVGGVAAIDSRTLCFEQLALPSGSELVVVDSGVRRELAASPWTDRRRESMRQARTIGVERLRDADPLTETDGLPLARHVIDEIGRVGRFADALRVGDAAAAGALMVESHASSRDLWGSSTPELDLLVEELVAGGAHGARLTGGGFGGWVVALCAEGTRDDVVGRAAAAYRRTFGASPPALVVRPAPAAGLLV